MKVAEISSDLPALMGILNVTPDSFYDSGKYFEFDRAIKKADQINAAGAVILDVGGESTRPGSDGTSPEEETGRVIPVIKEIKNSLDIRISCDTSKYKVAEKALAAGADMINDVTGFTDPEMRRVASEYDAAICIMHMQGSPKEMQRTPQYNDVLKDIRDFLYRQAEICEEDGIDHDNIIVDPGIGFGKTLEHNLKILANIDYFCEEYPVLVGASRKSFIQMLLGIPLEERLAGSLAVAGYCARKGVRMLRVHDVKETKEAVGMIKALVERENERVIKYN